MTQWLRTSRTSAGISLPLVIVPLALAGTMRAQQLIGYVNTRDADITGASDVLNGQAVLTGAAGVTARDHTAPITLGRGGTVRVCQTSVLHLTESRAVAVAAPLLFSLDRGAFEIQMMGTPSDSIMTPDMRFTVRKSGPLDLRLRVARNGDTCVENRGASAPSLSVSDPFGESMYEVGPGQHILFEHGSLHEVVDHETSSCGCPEAKGMLMADALLASGGPKQAAPPPPPPAATAPAPPAVVPPTPPPVVVLTAPPPTMKAAAPAAAPVAVPPPAAAPRPAVIVQTAAPPTVQAAVPAPAPAAPKAPDPAAELATQQAALQVAEQTAAQKAIQAAEAAQRHPFPAAISEGLAPPEPAPPAAPGHAQAPISDSLSYNATSASPAAPAPSATSRAKKAKPAKPAAAPTPAPAKPARAESPPSNDLAHIIGRFFRRLFGGH